MNALLDSIDFPWYAFLTILSVAAGA